MNLNDTHATEHARAKEQICCTGMSMADKKNRLRTPCLLLNNCDSKKSREAGPQLEYRLKAARLHQHVTE